LFLGGIKHKRIKMGWIKRRIDKEKSKHEGRLDWSRLAEIKIRGTILAWCQKNNIIPMKDVSLKLEITAGGYINFEKLKNFLEGTTQKIKPKEEKEKTF